jgi:transposase
MATERLFIRHTWEILRQKGVLGCTHRTVAQSLGVSVSTVGTTVLRARTAGVDRPEVERFPDDALEARLTGDPHPPRAPARSQIAPPCTLERKKPGVTLQPLHLEGLQQHPTGYRYTRFCDLSRQ